MKKSRMLECSIQFGNGTGKKLPSSFLVWLFFWGVFFLSCSNVFTSCFLSPPAMHTHAQLLLLKCEQLY